MKLKLLENMVAVERDPTETITNGGVMLPLELTKKPQFKGTVRYVGPGKMAGIGVTIPMTARVGDKAYWTSYSGIPVEVDNVELLIMAETEILALERKDEEALESAQ